MGRLIDFETEGGIPEDLSDRTAWTNGILMNKTLATLAPGEKEKNILVSCKCSFNMLSF